MTPRPLLEIRQRQLGRPKQVQLQLLRFVDVEILDAGRDGRGEWFRIGHNEEYEEEVGLIHDARLEYRWFLEAAHPDGGRQRATYCSMVSGLRLIWD